MSELKAYLGYIQDVLGVQKVILPPVTLTDELTRYRTETGHFPAQKHQDLIVLHQGEGLFGKGDDAELWRKMKAAMKLDGRSVLEMEFDFALNQIDLKKLLEIYRASVVLVLSPTPKREENHSLDATLIIETFSPQVLRDNAALKKLAWADLQSAMKVFALN